MSENTPFKNPVMAEKFAAYPELIQEKLLFLRRLILEIATENPAIGKLEETLKWGQPSYLTTETKSGSTLRMDQIKSRKNTYALYFNCQTTLVETFRGLFPNTLKFEGNRSIVFDASTEIPEKEIRKCILMALTYHLNKRK